MNPEQVVSMGKLVLELLPNPLSPKILLRCQMFCSSLLPFSSLSICGGKGRREREGRWQLIDKNHIQTARSGTSIHILHQSCRLNFHLSLPSLLAYSQVLSFYWPVYCDGLCLFLKDHPEDFLLIYCQGCHNRSRDCKGPSLSSFGDKLLIPDSNVQVDICHQSVMKHFCKIDLA